MALLALSPFIVLSTAALIFERRLVSGLDTTEVGVSLAASLANAGYAFGAVVAADLIQRVPKRRLFLANEAVFVVGSLACALAPGIAVFTVGRVLEGVSTGLLLVVALPPLVTTHGVEKLPLTAALVNLGLFGMVTAGPVVGTLFVGLLSWRVLFAAAAVLGLVGLVLGLLAFDRDAPQGRHMGFDFSAIPVAALATFLPFLGVSLLAGSSFSAPRFWAPLAVGLAALVLLLVRQYRKSRALMPLKLLAHTLPVTGLAVAMVAGAAFTALLELCVVYLSVVHGSSMVVVGGLLAAQVPGVLVATWLFKRTLGSRWLAALAFSGLGVVGLAGGVLLLLVASDAVVLTLPFALLLGFGAGAGVPPALFMAGLSVPSTRLGPTFALVELLRSQSAFLVAPVLLAVAMSASELADGIRLATWVVTALAAAGGLALLGLLLAGGVGPHRPDLETWLDGEDSAFESPPLAARARRH